MLSPSIISGKPNAKRLALWILALVATQAAATVIFLVIGYTFPLAAALGIFLILLSYAVPRAALALWLMSICLLPFWLGVHYFTYLPPASLTGLCVLIGAFHRVEWRLTRADVYALGVCTFTILISVLGLSLPGHGANVLFQWVVAFFVGRILVQRTGLLFAYRAITVIFTVTAALAVIEFSIGWNPYYSLSGNSVQADILASAQIRGGFERSEWAFGHSIALANSIAMAIPIALAARMNRFWTLVSVIVMMIGVLVTFSRSGILTAILAFLLSYLFASDRRATKRMTTALASLVVVAWVALPSILEVFSSASAETLRSAEHRVTILSLIPHLNFIGVADGYTETAGGQFVWHGVISIDNAFLRIGVNFGILVALAFLFGALVIALRVLRRRASVPTTSILAVIPALFTVSLITQFGALFWFYVGLAALTWTDTRADAITSGDEHNSVQVAHTK